MPPVVTRQKRGAGSRGLPPRAPAPPLPGRGGASALRRVGGGPAGGGEARKLPHPWVSLRSARARWLVWLLSLKVSGCVCTSGRASARAATSRPGRLPQRGLAQRESLLQGKFSGRTSRGAAPQLLLTRSPWHESQALRAPARGWRPAARPPAARRPRGGADLAGGTPAPRPPRRAGAA